jgi:hypothetical protein
MTQETTKSGIVYLKVIILLSIFGSLSLPSVSQDHKTINLKEIHQRKVCNYIVSRSIDQMNDYSTIHASWKKNIDESDFHVIEKTFYVENKLSDVWYCYRHTSPLEMWSGRSVRFGLLISKYSNSVSYINSFPFPEIDTGQVIFLNLRLIKGLFKIPVAFEIITIDREKQIMEFSYIDKNKSLGKQTLLFFDNGDGTTRIIHRSFFKSESAFRDGLLYPFFHEKFVEEFHRNMKKRIKIPKRGIIVLNEFSPEFFFV